MLFIARSRPSRSFSSSYTTPSHAQSSNIVTSEAARRNYKKMKQELQNRAPILITTGEPAGIGPDLVVQLLQQPCDAPLAIVGDAELLLERAKMLGVKLVRTEEGLMGKKATAILEQTPLRVPSVPGKLDQRNVDYVMSTLKKAVASCMSGKSSAMITGPVQKSVILEAGYEFSGHTEFLAKRAGVSTPVMMLVNDTLRVALATVHMPLSEVALALTADRLERVLCVVNEALIKRFNINKPVIGVCGLNPHAGESGHLGEEETETMAPVLRKLNDSGLVLEGPLPADTVFAPSVAARFDAIVAMYHDQGLPVIKRNGIGFATNITLGLPFIRTSVDHGTALSIAGTGTAETRGLISALGVTQQLIDAK